MPKTTEFTFRGHECTVIEPDVPAAGKPYVWRTEFLYAFNGADTALLELGYHIVYCGFSDEYGSERAVLLFKEFHDCLVRERGLSEKASLFGFSRGGLYAINYACRYPEDVACIYLDAPVVDLCSWPGGLGKGCGSPQEWEDCKKTVLGISEDGEAAGHPQNPANHLDVLFETGIPVLIVAGDSDRVVPFEENGKLISDYFGNRGREIQVIIKKGCDHHPHSLEDVTPVTDFVINSQQTDTAEG